MSKLILLAFFVLAAVAIADAHSEDREGGPDERRPSLDTTDNLRGLGLLIAGRRPRPSSGRRPSGILGSGRLISGRASGMIENVHSEDRNGDSYGRRPTLEITDRRRGFGGRRRRPSRGRRPSGLSSGRRPSGISGSRILASG